MLSLQNILQAARDWSSETRRLKDAAQDESTDSSYLMSQLDREQMIITNITKLRLQRLLKHISRPQKLTFCCHIFYADPVFVCHVAEDREDGEPREETGHAVHSAGQQGVPADGTHTVSQSVTRLVISLHYKCEKCSSTKNSKGKTKFSSVSLLVFHFFIL